jgi:hypothetical protein
MKGGYAIKFETVTVGRLKQGDREIFTLGPLEDTTNKHGLNREKRIVWHASETVTPRQKTTFTWSSTAGPLA